MTEKMKKGVIYEFFSNGVWIESCYNIDRTPEEQMKIIAMLCNGSTHTGPTKSGRILTSQSPNYPLETLSYKIGIHDERRNPA